MKRRWFRRRSTDGANDDQPPGDQLTLANEAVLVEVDDEGSFLVFGGDIPGLDVLPLSLLSDQDRRTLGQGVARSVGAMNVGVQTAQQVSEATGLVRLAPETLAQLRSGAQPLTKEGWNLGTLISDGEFSHSVRWLPAESAGAVSLLASIGPAATLIAVQWQLAQISKLVEKNLALTNQVLRAVRTTQWADVRAHSNLIMKELQNAEAVGAVTTEIWEHAQAQGSATRLDGHQQQFRELVHSHLQNLSTRRGVTSRRLWFLENGETVLRDVDALLIAERAWFCYQVLRVGYLNETAARDPRSKILQQTIVETARIGYADALAESRPLLDGMYRLFRLMEQCPGGRGLTVRGRIRAPREVAVAAGTLADQIRAATGSAVPEALDVSPSHGWINVEGDRSAITDRLRWLLEPLEAVIAVVCGITDLWWSSGYVVFTDERVLFLKKNAFLKEGAIDREVEWSDVEAVRRSGKSGPAGGQDIVITETNGERIVHLTKTVTMDEAARLVDLLRSFVDAGSRSEDLELPPGVAGDVDSI